MNDITWDPAWRIAESVQAGVYSPVAVLEHFLSRIEEFDPVLGAFDVVDHERARRDAEHVEADLRAGREVGPLAGVPMAVKSLIDVEGLPLLTGGVARRDNLIVDRLRRAGALVVGHAGLPAIGADGSFDYSTCARNPWDPSRISGFSSAGCAAAVAAGLLPAAIGSDGLGSTRLPAAYCGVIGVHGTNGLVPIVDEWGRTMNYFESRGPMVRDVRDAALILSVIAGPDPRDDRGVHLPQPDPAAELGLGVAGLKLGWAGDFGTAMSDTVDESDEVISHIRSMVDVFTTLGGQLSDVQADWEDHTSALAQYLMPEGLPTAGVTKEDGGSAIREDAWGPATEVRRRMLNQFAQVFDAVDVVVSPVVHSVAPTAEVFARRVPDTASIMQGMPGSRGYTAYTALFNWLRLPAISVPCGFVRGLPVALQLVGPAASDARLLRVAEAFLDAVPRTERPMVGAGGDVLAVGVTQS